MIDLYFWTTPNGYKVTIMLAELGLHYCVLLIDITKDDQFRPEFPKISPNNRIPAIIDHDGPVRRGFPIFENFGHSLKTDILYEGSAQLLFEVANLIENSGH